MPALKYALEKGEPRRLVFSWKSIWNIKAVTIYLDGNEIGSIAGKKELKAGQQFPLRDGTLKVRLDRWTFEGWKFEVSKDGQLLVADPTPRLRNSYAAIFFVAGSSILWGILGLVTELFQVEYLKQLGADYTAIIFGAIFIVLGFLVRKRSRIALGIAVGMHTLNSIIFLIVTPGTGILVRVFLLVYMFRGFSAIRDLKQGW